MSGHVATPRRQPIRRSFKANTASMFGFGKSRKQPLADRRSAEQWLATLPSRDVLDAHGQLMTALARLGDRETRRTPAALAALLHVDQGTRDLRLALTAQYLEHAGRSGRLAQQLWQALFDLTQTFLLAYMSFAREIAANAHVARWQAMLPELVLRQILHLAVDARVRLHRHEPWIPAKWSELHARFALACANRFERQPIALDGSEATDAVTTTIEQAYVGVLILQALDAGQIAPRQLEWIASALDAWCATLRLTLEPASVSSFYIDLDARAGLRRRTPAPLEGRVLFLDTRPLLALLQHDVVQLDRRIRHEPLSPRSPERTEELAFLGKLAARLDPEFHPLPRRGERVAAAGMVDAIVGFGHITAYLREAGRLPPPEVTPSAEGVTDLALFGRVRPGHETQDDPASRLLAAHAPPGGPWEVKDVSRSGYRLLAPMPVAGDVGLGTLVALRLHGRTVWLLGIVRRIRRLTAARAEIGLQIIADTLSGLELVGPVADDGGYSVEGETTTLRGRTFHGLFLALARRDPEREPPVRSLVVPAAEHRPGRRLEIAGDAAAGTLRFGRTIEAGAEWVWSVVEQLGPTAPLAAP